MITRYDYDAPLTEYGFARQPKYRLLQRLHAALHTFEAAIVGADAPKQWWNMGVAGMPGLSSYSYSGKVAFLVNSNRTADFTLHYNCTAMAPSSSSPPASPHRPSPASLPASPPASVEVAVPHWSVTIIDGTACTVVVNTAAESGAPPPPPPAEAGPAGGEDSAWSFWAEPTDLAWCTGAGKGGQVPKAVDVPHLPEHII